MPFDHPVTLILLASLTLLVRVGMAWHAAGLVRSKNAAGMVFRHVCDLSFAALAFWAIGAAFFQFSGRSIIGFNPRMIVDIKGDSGAATFVHLVLILLSTSLISGALGERTKLLAVAVVSIVMAGFVLPIAASWAWRSQGWLARLGFIDVGGATVIHLSGGVCALIGAIFVGPRAGKYNRDGSSNLIPAHNLPIASVGVLLILIGWLPYLLAAGAVHQGFHIRIAQNTLLASAAGAVVAMILSRVRYGKPDVLLTYGGLLGALVSISAAPHAVSSIGAVAIGALAGWIVPMATVWIDLKFKIDDPVGVIAVHGVGGLWGTLAAAVFVPDTLSGKLRQLGWQAIGAASISIFVAIAALAVFVALRATIGLRCKEADEYDGLDLAEHDLNAYPDFQQTMIKSYHMREA